MLLAFLLILTLLPVTAIASDNASTFSFTNSPRENIQFILGDNKLTVANLPDKEAYSSVWVSIFNANGRLQAQQVLDRKADGSVSMPLSGLSNGNYYIEFYFSATGNTFASYVFGNEVRFRWNDGAGSFIASPTYEQNKKTYEAGRSDIAALAYYLDSTKTIQSSDAGIIKLAREITSGINDNYKKAIALHDWVCSNVWYDWDAAESGRQIDGDAVSVLKSRRAICVGYTNLMAALLRVVGIPAKAVSGYGLITAKTGEWTQKQLSGNNTNHYWNEAYIDGRWVIIDVTWDSGNDYRGGKKTSSKGLYYSRYFDATVEAFSINHRIVSYSEKNIPQPDKPSSWAAQQVDAAISNGFVPIKMRVNFTRATTRAEFCALAVALYEGVVGKEITGRQEFGDTSDINVEKMAYLGVVYGVGGNKFSPNEALNREQAAIMFSRLADVLGCPLAKGDAVFNDISSISSWAVEAVGMMQSANLMGDAGGNNFSPRGKLTREQSIVTIERLYNAVKSPLRSQYAAAA